MFIKKKKKKKKKKSILKKIGIKTYLAFKTT